MTYNALMSMVANEAARYLYDRCTIEAASVAADEYGGSAQTWEVVGEDVPCRVILSGTGADASGVSSLYEGVGAIDRALEVLGEALSIGQMREIITRTRNHIGTGTFAVFWEQTTGAPLPEWLNAPRQNDQEAARVMELLKVLYAAGGADAVRKMLKGKLPDEVIEAIPAQLGGEA